MVTNASDSVSSNSALHKDQNTLRSELDDLRQLKIAKNNIYRSKKSAKNISMIEWEEQQRAFKEADRQSKCMAMKQLHNYRPLNWKNHKNNRDEPVVEEKPIHKNSELFNANDDILFVQKTLDDRRGEEKVEDEEVQCNPYLIHDEDIPKGICSNQNQLEDFKIRNEEKVEDEFFKNNTYVIEKGQLVLKESENECLSNVEDGKDYENNKILGEKPSSQFTTDVKVFISRKTSENYRKEIVDVVQPQNEFRQQYTCGCTIS
mmetsp:Transcript_18396/g.27794  ORF Transcript_18396/g.27794 Transcript_18396/m.27794 type:complete len:261 (-) Transcript_18396:12-794(-)